MKLDILVPHWQETREEMEPLLDSVMVQQGIDLGDVGVIIAYDGPEASELPVDEWAERYPFPITHVHANKGGVSHTRNAALDVSEADYVMFCDADDCFCDSCGLFLVFREMESQPNPQELAMYGVTPQEAGTGFDTLVSVFREENKDPKTGDIVYLNRDNDSTFVHGKVHRRQYLLDNGLRFDDSLTIHEDSYFNILCRECAKPYRAKYCPMPFYLWKWRDASVCRHDDKYILKTFRNMLDSNDALVDEFTRRMMPEKATQYCAMMVFDSYYTMCKPEWLSEVNAEYRERTERRFAKYFRKHRKKWDSLTQQEKAVISNGVRQRSVMEGMLVEPITVDDWLDRVLRKY
mgnify:CR=1 FL=1